MIFKLDQYKVHVLYSHRKYLPIKSKWYYWCKSQCGSWNCSHMLPRKMLYNKQCLYWRSLFGSDLQFHDVPVKCVWRPLNTTTAQETMPPKYSIIWGLKLPIKRNRTIQRTLHFTCKICASSQQSPSNIMHCRRIILGLIGLQLEHEPKGCAV